MAFDLPVSTRSICPHCRRVLEAELHEREGRVFLRRHCPEHGEIEALAYGDAERWRAVQPFNKPGAAPLERQTEIVDGCPSDCGVCPAHARRACLGRDRGQHTLQPRLSRAASPSPGPATRRTASR